MRKAFTALLCLNLVLGGCTGTSVPQDDDNDIGQGSISVYAGYPERVTIPNTAKVGEEIPVLIELSAAQRPGLLAGDLSHRWIKTMYPMYMDGEVVGFAIDLWFGAEHEGDLPTNILDSTIPGMPDVGVWTIRLYSPATRHEGGAFGKYFLTPTTARPSTIDYVYTDYVINVTP